MQNKTSQGQKVVSPVLNRVAKWAIFVLNSAGVWRPRRHSSTHTSLECPPYLSRTQKWGILYISAAFCSVSLTNHNILYIFNAVPLGSVPELPATSCHEISANEGKRMDDGTYWMLLSGKIVRAFCNMTTQPEGTFCSSSVRPEFIRSIIGWDWLIWCEELCRSAASVDNAMQELHYFILHIIRKSNPIIVLWLNLKCFIFSP